MHILNSYYFEITTYFFLNTYFHLSPFLCLLTQYNWKKCMATTTTKNLFSLSLFLFEMNKIMISTCYNLKIFLATESPEMSGKGFNDYLMMQKFLGHYWKKMHSVRMMISRQELHGKQNMVFALQRFGWRCLLSTKNMEWKLRNVIYAHMYVHSI